MKIAFIANTSWNIYNFRKGLVKYFLEQGEEVLVLAPRDEYSEKIEHWGVKFIETPVDGTGSNPIKDYAYLRQLISIFKKERPQVSLSYTIKCNIYASIAGKLMHVKTICNVSGLGTVFLVKGLTGKIALWLYRFAFQFSDYVFFQNSDDQTLFLSKVRLNNNIVGLLPGSGIDLNDFSFSAPKIEVPLKILMISRVIEEKGVKEYVAAAQSFKNDEVTFTLVGKFDENHARSISRGDLNRWIKNGFIQYIPHSDSIKDLIEAHEIIMLPSYREGTSRTLLEGAAIGRTLMASNVAGCREVINEGFNGFLFKVRDHESIVFVINHYRSLSHEQKMLMASNSRKLVEEKFNENIVVERYKKVINLIRTDRS